MRSFTLAGRELGMSQAAVSYAIRNLEDQLGAALFRRAHRAVFLTAAGERFLADVTLGLSHIRKSAEEIAAVKDEAHVTLSVSNAFAAMWMVPRLQRAREALPGIDLRLQTSDRDVDIAAENLPLGIRGGDPARWPLYASALFAQEEIIAVASPAYASAHGGPAAVQELAFHNLIHLGRAAPHRAQLGPMADERRRVAPLQKPQPHHQRLCLRHPRRAERPGRRARLAASGRTGCWRRGGWWT